MRVYRVIMCYLIDMNSKAFVYDDFLGFFCLNLLLNWIRTLVDTCEFVGIVMVC